MTHFIQTLISGLSLGSIYALIALGYTMVYGIAKMLNFAHGDIIMIGAYAGIIAVAQMGLPPLIAVLLSILICALLGVLIEFLAYKPLRQAPPLSVLITAIGVSYFLQNLALILFGSQQKAYPTIVQLGQVTIGSVTIDGVTILTLLVTALIMVVLSFFINRTRMGKAMRAVSEDKAAAALMGISVNRTISITFAIGSALAASSMACPMSTSSPPPAPCPASRPLRQPYSAGSARCPAPCWAASCSASSSSSPKPIFPPSGQMPSSLAFWFWSWWSSPPASWVKQ